MNKFIKYTIWLFLAFWSLKLYGSIDTLKPVNAINTSISDTGIIEHRNAIRIFHHYYVDVCGNNLLSLKLKNLHLRKGNKLEIFYYRRDSLFYITPLTGLDSAAALAWKDSTISFTGYNFHIHLWDSTKSADMEIHWTTRAKETIGNPGFGISASPDGNFFTGIPYTFTVNWNVFSRYDVTWNIDGAPINNRKTLSYSFITPGNYIVAAIVNTCLGRDTVLRILKSYGSPSEVDLKIMAQYEDTLKSGKKLVQLSAISRSANSFRWQISPSSYTIISGSLKSPDLIIHINDSSACYNAAITAYHSNDSLRSTVSDSISGFYCKGKLRRFIKTTRPAFTVFTYEDIDRNGRYNNGDKKLSGIPVHKRNTNLISLTDLNGFLSLYNRSTDLIKLKPDTTYWKPFGNNSSGVSTDTVIAGSTINLGLISTTNKKSDIRIDALTSPIIKGFKHHFFIEISNNGNKDPDSLRLTFQSDRILQNAEFSFKSQTWKFNSDSIFIFTLKKTYTAMNYGQLKISFDSPVNDSGIYHFKAALFGADGTRDADSANNQQQFSALVVRPFDPNDLTVSPEGAFERQIQELNYRIRFQNTGTWYARNVVITDTLPTGLNPETFVLKHASHPVEVGISGQTVRFVFNEIYLPDSNTNEPESKGEVHFSVQTTTTLKPYQKLVNFADIYFDFEQPVRTNSTINYWKSPPTIKINGKKIDTIHTCEIYYDMGATASDLTDGNLDSVVRRTGNFLNKVAGSYRLSYFAVNSFGDTGWAYRTVIVKDSSRPHILFNKKHIKNSQEIRVHIGEPFSDSIYALDICEGPVKLISTDGINGPVNSNVRGTYPVIYYAADTNGNNAYESGYEIRYLVDDFIPPRFYNNGNDTLCHQINTPFTPPLMSAMDNYYSSSDIKISMVYSVNVYISGYYPVRYTATDKSGNSSSIFLTIWVTDCHSTRKSIAEPNQDITVFPVPSTNEVFITGINSLNKSCSIHVSDLSGRIVQISESQNDKGTCRINFSGLLPGTYLLTIISEDKTIIKKTYIMKQ